MFGDTFGTKSDYTKGMNYSVRMTYMGDEVGHLSLNPPDTMFLSREAARKMVGDHNEANDPVTAGKRRNEAAPKLTDAPDGATSKISNILANRAAKSPKSKAALMKETAQKNAARKVKELELASAENPDPVDVWYIANQAGVTFYMNRLTGEATLENPFDDDARPFDDMQCCKPRLDPDLSVPLATGFVVYEQTKIDTGFDKVMAFLDRDSKVYE